MKRWSRLHSNGWEAQIYQRDEDWYEGAIRNPAGMLTATQGGTNPDWLQGSLDFYLCQESRHSDCTCGAWRLVEDGPLDG